MWWKKNRWKVLLPLLAAALLAAAFWYGGNAPGQRGWRVDSGTAPPSAAATPSPAPAPSPSGTPGAAPPELTPASAPLPSPTPSPSASPAPSPAQTPAPASETPSGGPVCTLSISCADVLEHMDWLAAGVEEVLPEDGWILPSTQWSFQPGDSVFDVLRDVCRDRGIPLEFSGTPLAQTVYIEGIQNLYEFDCGELSGWTYQVNGEYPDYSCSLYPLQDGDSVVWLFTCNRTEQSESA